MLAGAALGVTACAYDDLSMRGRAAADYAYAGQEWGGERQPFDGELSGPGVQILDDWLKETREGRTLVTLGFHDAAEGVVSEDVAHRANVWFRRYADQDHDMRITDPEIRTALVAAAGRYTRASD
jgi:hypothetical protein